MTPCGSCCARLGLEGWLVNIGSAAGSATRFASAAVRSRLYTIPGCTNNALTREQKAEALTITRTYTSTGCCTVERETLPLTNVAEAWERQAAFARRKLILVP